MNEDTKPPSNKTNMGAGTGLFPARNSLAKRFKGIWRLWMGDWSICPIRGDVCIRRYSVLMDIQGK